MYPLIVSLCAVDIVTCSPPDITYLHRWMDILSTFNTCLWRRPNAATTSSQRAASKHESLKKCRFNVGPPSTTLDQHWTNIDSTSRVCEPIPKDVFRPSSSHYSVTPSHLQRQFVKWILTKREGDILITKWYGLLTLDRSTSTVVSDYSVSWG